MIEVDFSAATLTWQNAWLWLLAALMCWFVARRVFVVLLTAKGYAPTPVASRLLSHLVRSRNLSEDQFLRADGAEEQFVGARRNALGRLAASLNGKSPASSAWADGVRESLSDLRFADANRVPFPFAKVMRERFNAASVAQATEGPYLRDLDGNRSLDVSGSYGVNVTGYDSYKGFIERGWQKVKDLGIVLGPLHPLVADNMERLKRISGQEEVSFHVSGTEAVMAAVRLARFNTRRKKIVCFSGAYHGWWDGVQPGIGSERRIDDVLALKEMNPGSLDVIRLRAKEIAGVLVNPVQSFHPNSPPPNDAVLLSSDVRKTETQSASYGEWLRKLKAVCDECNVPLMFDEVYSGFRLAPGGAQQYFGVKADMVVYGKTLAGGLPIGVVCGPKSLMRRFDPDRPMRIAYVVGTFSAYPLAVGAMNEFLTWLESPEAAPAYAAVEARAAGWVARANAELEQSGLPVRVVNLGTIWTLEFKDPSRFKWLLQY
ncbi:MAG: aminotransferase class III-fold pyridoxal phosphate-dependent enzyme [Pseudomonadota bacterium]